MERNITLDYFKIFLSILVITIHIGPLSASYPLFNWLISQGIARIAVPCFFIVNGYYLVKKLDDFKALKKYLLHLLLIYIIWSAFYILFETKQINITSFIEYFLFGIYHLWYVIALIVGALLLFLAKKIVKNDIVLLILSILILIIGFFVESTQKTSLYVVRNGFFIGFPFIFFGYYIHSKAITTKLKDIYILPAIILSFITLCLESSFARETGLSHDLYLSLIILCPAAIIFIFKHSKYKKANTYLTYLGSMASAIYFIHYSVIFKLSEIEIPYMLIRFTAVFLISAVLSIIIIYINKYLKIFL